MVLHACLLASSEEELFIHTSFLYLHASYVLQVSDIPQTSANIKLVTFLRVIETMSTIG